MIKKTEQKKNKKIMLIVKTIIVIVVVVMLWCFYSLVRFDGIYSPIYVWGLSNPYKYYQKHIGSLLVKHGTEYKLKPTIDEQNPKTYNVYRNEEHRFEFKYPKGTMVQTNKEFYPNISTNLTILDSKNRENKCVMFIMYKGWGVGRSWLPRRRECVNWMVSSHKDLQYFYAKNGQIVHTTNCGYPSLNLLRDKEALIDYIDKKTGKMYYITIGGEQCPKELLVNVITTFKFME